MPTKKPKKGNILEAGDNKLTKQARQAVTEIVRRIIELFKLFYDSCGIGHPVIIHYAGGYIQSC
jgi:hypothetical protein